MCFVGVPFTCFQILKSSQSQVSLKRALMILFVRFPSNYFKVCSIKNTIKHQLYKNVQNVLTFKYISSFTLTRKKKSKKRKKTREEVLSIKEASPARSKRKMYSPYIFSSSNFSSKQKPSSEGGQEDAMNLTLCELGWFFQPLNPRYSYRIILFN